MNRLQAILADLAIAVVFLALVGPLGCGRVSTLDSGSRSELNAAHVPDDLRHLLPLAKRWGIGDDMDRAAALERASDEELQTLRDAVQTHSAAITHWLDSFSSGAAMSDEAAAFMYMQLAVEELPR